MIRFKSCPKCSGDLLFDWDFLGWYEQCIQCGHMAYLQDISTDWDIHAQMRQSSLPSFVVNHGLDQRAIRAAESSPVRPMKLKKWEQTRKAAHAPWWPQAR